MIANFTDSRFYLDLPGAREDYLQRIESALATHDCTMLAFSLMSSHVHWLLQMGLLQLESFFKSVHGGFAGYINLRITRRGAVFAGRFKNIELAPETVPIVAAYIHNNEVRADVIEHPAESAWSSHRAYLGLEPAPDWLAVEKGLAACGFDATPAGRAGFGAWVAAQAGLGRMPALSGEGLAADRRVTLEDLPGCAELQSPVLRAPGNLEYPVAIPAISPRARAWAGEVEIVLEVAAVLGSVPTSRLCATGRDAAAAETRAAVLLAWRDGLGRPLIQAARALGLSSGGASKARARAWRIPAAVELARRICDECWMLVPA